MTISQIRSVIDTASWNRRDFSGYSHEEFFHADVPRILSAQIEALRGLQIHRRFTRDIERRDNEITRCETVIERWQSMKTTPPPRPAEYDPETSLRSMWTAAGVSRKRQDELIAGVTAKARPGARVGPFTM